MDPALLELLRAGPPDQEVEAVLRLTDPAARVPGVRIVSRFGTIVTCRLPLGRVIETREQDEVASLKAARLLAPEVPAVQSDSELRTRASDIRRPSGLRYTGRGCVVGFLDWGFAFGGASLRHSDGRTRLLALWDQRRDDPRRPNHYGYGSIHDAGRLNAALATGDPYRALGYHPAESDASKIGSHGAHTVDIAVGNGRGGGPMGLAPEADIVCVHLATEALGANPLENLGDSVRALEGIDFIRRVAGERPFVISASIGRHAGPHDGTTMLERSCDWLLSQNPNALSIHSVGNYHSRNCHAAASLKRGETHTLRLLIDPNDRTPNEVEIWYDRGTRLSIRIETPDGEQSRWVPLGQRAELASAGRIVCRIYHRECDPQNEANLIDLFIEAGPGAGEWRLILRADEAPGAGSVFHAWVERDDACGACQARFHPDDADSSVTTSTLANGTRTISVGAVDAHDPARSIAHFSSAGPTRDGRMKPDCVAPGVGVLAARSPWFGEPDANAHARRSGTSMAAPHVAGCAALLLEAGRGQFGDGELREIILSTVDAPGAGSEPNRYGHGYLNVQRALAAAERVARRRETPAGRSFVHFGALENYTMPSQRDFSARLLDFADQLVGQAQNVTSDELLRAVLRQVSGFESPPPARSVFRAMRDSGRPADLDLRNGMLKVIGPSLERFSEPIAPGDVIVRRALGEGGATHVAIVAGPELKREELAAAGLTPEDDAPGWYVQVVEGGLHPHGMNDRFARRVRDSSMRSTADQIVVRLAPFLRSSTHESIDGPSGSEWEGSPHRADDSDSAGGLLPSAAEDDTKKVERAVSASRASRMAVAAMDPDDIHYLSFEGGGGKGAAYLGALAALAEPEIGLLKPIVTSDRRGVQHVLDKTRVFGVSGASAGAITAALLASGYDLDELRTFMSNRDLLDRFYDRPRDRQGKLARPLYAKGRIYYESRPVPPENWFRDWVVSSSPWWSKILSLLGRPLVEAAKVAELVAADLLAKVASAYFGPDFPTAAAKITKTGDFKAYLDNLKWDLGLFSGQFAWETLDKMISEKTEDIKGEKIKGVTFAQHLEKHKVELVLTGTNLETGESRFFSAFHTPDFSVADAVRISLSLPFLFKPVVIKLGPQRGTWIDGGVLNNNPIHAFDTPGQPGTIHSAMLGLRLGVDYPSPTKPMHISTVGAFSIALKNAMLSPSERSQIRTPEEEAQTISMAVDPLSTSEFFSDDATLLVVCCRAARQVLKYFGRQDLDAGRVLPTLLGRCPPAQTQ